MADAHRRLVSSDAPNVPNIFGIIHRYTVTWSIRTVVQSARAGGRDDEGERPKARAVLRSACGALRNPDVKAESLLVEEGPQQVQAARAAGAAPTVIEDVRLAPCAGICGIVPETSIAVDGIGTWVIVLGLAARRAAGVRVSL